MEAVLEHFWSQTEVLAGRLTAALAILLAFWLAAMIVEGLISRLMERLHAAKQLLNLLQQTARTFLFIFGVLTALGTLGVDTSALVAGLGLTGFALGFAFRDILSNLLAGVLLILYRPFGTGDRITVTALEGLVRSIDLRYTELESTGKTVLIPNSNLFTNPITVVRADSARSQ